MNIWDRLDTRNPVPAYELNVKFNAIEECPQCKAIISPRVLQTAIFYDGADQRKLAVIFLCERCKRSFIAQYSSYVPCDNPSLRSGEYFRQLDFCGPKSFAPHEFPPAIEKISKDFTEIFNQSLAAETSGLNLIAGVGYRKALEFLVKDFLIAQRPKDTDQIRSTALGTCINNYIDNPQLKSLAKGAGYLGNDQTHYEQKYTSKDIHDLKRMITATVNTIETILIAEEAESLPHPSTFK